MPACAPQRPVLRLDEFLPYRLNRLTEAVSQGLARLYSDQYGINVAEWRVIAGLGEHAAVHGPDGPGVTARDITRRSRLGKVAVSRAAASLIERGLVTRHPNREDRREAFLRLTAKGEEIYAAIVPRALAFQAALEQGIPECDARAFDRVVRHLLDRADAADATLAAIARPQGAS